MVLGLASIFLAFPKSSSNPKLPWYANSIASWWCFVPCLGYAVSSQPMSGTQKQNLTQTDHFRGVFVCLCVFGMWVWWHQQCCGSKQPVFLSGLDGSILRGGAVCPGPLIFQNDLVGQPRTGMIKDLTTIFFQLWQNKPPTTDSLSSTVWNFRVEYLCLPTWGSQFREIRSGKSFFQRHRKMSTQEYIHYTCTNINISYRADPHWNQRASHKLNWIIMHLMKLDWGTSASWSL